MDNQNTTLELIERMSYTDFISFIKETNRCPGGKDAVRKIIQNSFINNESKVLEIGSNTGFTSLEIAHMVKCSVLGIDINKNCVDTANSLLKEDTKEIQDLVVFKEGSAYDIPASENMFDLVMVGGATSFMDKKNKAISEYIRVLKPWGFLSVTQLFYVTIPPQGVVDAVSNVIGVEIKPWGEREWLRLFSDQSYGLELYYYERNRLTNRPDDVLDNYIQYFMEKPHLSKYSDDVRGSIRSKWRNYLTIFNENHKYLGYFIALFRKRMYEEEPELFIKALKNDR